VVAYFCYFFVTALTVGPEDVGLGEFTLSHELKRDKLYFNLKARKGLNLELKGMVRSRLYYNPFRTNRSNQYFMLAWYVGQAESMLEYEQSRSMLRIGYVIRSNELNLFRGDN
jgi:phospholipase A1